MQSPRFLRIGAWFITAVFASTNTLAGTITLADSPLHTGLIKAVAPNILFVLDDSGSMDSEYMPDEVDKNNTKACYRNYGYNTIYYNPNQEYKVPLKYNGDEYAGVDPTKAYEDGFAGSGTYHDLTSYVDTPFKQDTSVTAPKLSSNPLKVGKSSKTITVTHSGAKIDGGSHTLATDDYVVFAGLSGTTNGIDLSKLNGVKYQITVTSSTTYTFQIGSNSNNNSATSGGGSNVVPTYTYSKTIRIDKVPNYYYYTYNLSTTPPSTCDTIDTHYDKIGVNTLNATQQKNYANWYSFYRTRLLMMKTAAGRAFNKVSRDYRVGFTVISDKSTSTSWLDVARFDGTQKENWYKTLYDVNAGSYTPLRAALSKAGRYYAGKLVIGDKDPVQYSCQQNFTILTTDGYWNVDTESPHNTPAKFASPTAALTDAVAPGAATDNYGPFQMDNVTRVGDQDSAADPPMKDLNAKANTLADVAMYYYKTDLRPKGATGGKTDESTNIDVSEDNVPKASGDDAQYQHMVTFTLGLGVDGTLPNTAATITALKDGTKRWPDPITNTDRERIDDLWHAAVNGHGQYLSAKTADAVEEGLNKTLNAIKVEKGSSSAAATSNLQPVKTDNTAFIAQYETGNWVGDLQARSIAVDTGAISETNLWSAQAKLDTQVSAGSDTRNIYTFSGAAARKLKAFDKDNLATEIANGYFKPEKLSQYIDGVWGTDQKDAASAEKLINYLRGQRQHEDTASTPALATDLFRKRTHVLGDISSAAPVYVRKPVFSYLDSGYASFLSSQSGRAGTVYVGANDGMLHAFDGSADDQGVPTSTAGKERWAYIPSIVIPEMYRLADSQYAGNHRFFVDGPIAVGDAYNAGTSTWKTILVGGLGHGGRGYYALDVTDPANPAVLWEFDTVEDGSGNANLGYSYGNPIITKRDSDGKWVVIFASGYNNTGGGDGKGRLFVVDAFSGAELSAIPTDNTVTDPNLSGIARVSNYVEDGLKDNRTQYVYGGDLSGNLWRFDINDKSSIRLGKTSATAGALPITLQPELARVRDDSGNWHRVVYFGTGRALGPNDLSSLDASYGVDQTVFAVKDKGMSLGVLTDTDVLVKQTLKSGVTPRVIDPLQPVNWETQNGWYVTTPHDSGERFYVDPGLQLGTLVIAANIAEHGYCNPTGSSILYQLDYKSGKVLMTTEYKNAQIVGITQLQTQGGTGPVVIDPVLANGDTGNTNQVNGTGGTGSTSRVSWREIE